MRRRVYCAPVIAMTRDGRPSKRAAGEDPGASMQPRVSSVDSIVSPPSPRRMEAANGESEREGCANMCKERGKTCGLSQEQRRSD